jgi:SAM-dependent methyltransferase
MHADLGDEGQSLKGKHPDFFEATEMPDALWWQALWPDPAGVLRAVGLNAGMDAIDLCAGDGWFTLPMAKIARRVIAIDIDAKLLDVARRRLAEGGASNCEFIAGNAYDIAALVKGRVDFVLLANAFHGVPDKPRLCRAVLETLKAGGLFAVVNWHPRPRDGTTVLGEPRGPRTELRMSHEQTIAAVAAGGLRFTRLIELPPYHYGAVFTRTQREPYP